MPWTVIPANAGIQIFRMLLDPRFRGGDDGDQFFNGLLGGSAPCTAVVLPNEDGVGVIEEKVERYPLLSCRVDAAADLPRGEISDPLGSIAQPTPAVGDAEITALCARQQAHPARGSNQPRVEPVARLRYELRKPAVVQVGWETQQRDRAMLLRVRFRDQHHAGAAELNLTGMTVRYLASQSSAQPGQRPADATTRPACRTTEKLPRRRLEGTHEGLIFPWPPAVDPIVLDPRKGSEPADQEIS